MSWIDADDNYRNSDDDYDVIENMDDDDREREYGKMDEYGDDYMPPLR